MATAGAQTSNELEWNFVGTVTNLQTTYGIVDHSVYFDFSIVRGHKPTKGSDVRVQASRQHAEAGWIASSVTAVVQESDWLQGGFRGELERKVHIGQVTDARGLTGTIDKVHRFYEAAVPQGYTPCRGDWLSCQLYGSDDQWSVERVEPTRRRAYEGRITSMRQPPMINDDITFMKWSCLHPYRPQEGDLVEGEAIEHSGRTAEWRAITVMKAASKEAGLSRVSESLLRAVQMCKAQSRAPTTMSCAAVGIAQRLDLGSVEVGTCSRHKVAICNHGTFNVHMRSAVLVWPETMLDVVPPVELSLGSGEEGCIDLMLNARTRGAFQQTVVFDFGDSCLSRPLSYHVLAAGEGELVPTKPYQKPKSRAVPQASKEGRVVVPGRRTKRGIEMKYLPVKLKNYDVPPGIKQCCYEDGDVTEFVPELRENVSPSNYGQRFAGLLFLEEVQNIIDMHQFDMHKVRFCPRGPYLALNVPGLAEGRPSLLIGDTVSVTIADDGRIGPVYEGCIHEIIMRPDQQCILLKFSEQFHDHFDDSDYDVAFSIGRTPFKRCHLAVEVAVSVCQDVLFPTTMASSLPLAKLSAEELINKDLNNRQLAAVSRILGGQARPLPYLLFGPPGTGKTITVVESILQVFRQLPSSRILTCAPSNSAADLLATRLHNSGLITPADMVRFNAFQRRTPIPEELLEYSKNVEQVKEAVRFRIVVSTCVTAGMLYSQGLQLGHFSHVFVDEAGQCTEPESMIALGLAANQSGAAITVLAGDPYQLGPVLQSPIACEFGLQVSLLERMIERKLYQRDEAKFGDHGSYDPLLVTKLVQNYRCHPGILEVFSQIFYHGELLPCAALPERDRFCGWSELPNPNFPIIFHGLEGADMREGSSPSWFNPAEIVQTADYLKALLDSPELGVSIEDIGIITPYRKQVEKMRHFLGNLDLKDVKIGSVEEFQGQERPVVIISTVRSQECMVLFDREHQIGFLSNPKRFNVSISRAKSLMIVVGNPNLLVQDPFWKLLLTYCVRNGAYRGCPLPSLDTESSLLADPEE